MENYQTTDESIYVRNKKIVIALGMLTVIITSPAPQIFGANSSTDITIHYLSAIVLNFLVFAWCHYDSSERHQPLGTAGRFLIIIFGLFALLIYLLKSRGFVKGLIAIGWAVLLFVITAVGAVLVMLIVNLITGIK